MHFEVEHSTQFATSPCFSSVYVPPLNLVFLNRTNPRGSSDSPLDNEVVEIRTLGGLLLDRTDDGAEVFDVLSNKVSVHSVSNYLVYGVQNPLHGSDRVPVDIGIKYGAQIR